MLRPPATFSRGVRFLRGCWVVETEGTPNVVVLPMPHRLASGDSILQTIGTAALTAGKIEYVIKYMRA